MSGRERKARGREGRDTSAEVGPQQRGRVLILVQNLSVPFDRRVWLECQSLTAAGFQVAVVCPKAPGDPTYYRLRGVELFKYRPYAPGTSSVSFVLELWYSFIMTLGSASGDFRGRFDIVQSCNPPDLFWPIGLLFRVIHGSSFGFDHHDLCPELFRVSIPGREADRLRRPAADGTLHGKGGRPRDRHQRLVPAIVLERDGVSPSSSHRRPHGPGSGLAPSLDDASRGSRRPNPTWPPTWV